jgi:nicotinamide-nucleotide amidase
MMHAGLRVQRQTTVPDGDAIIEAMQEAMLRSDAVIVTGGIGPTSDDITREAAANVLGVELIEDANALRSIIAYFAKLDRTMADDNRKQAEKPAGAEILNNPHGTAPGIFTPRELNDQLNCALFLLPGPPGEMQPMFRNEVMPRLRALSAAPLDQSMRVLRFAGIGESDFHAALDHPFSKIPHLEVGYCARPGEVDLRLIGSETSIEQAAQIAGNVFGDKCFSDSEESLEAVVVQLLTASGQTLSLAESCTGGRIANRITDVSGASSVFTHGYVTYANEAKHEMLGVDSHLLEKHGAVSEEVALAMAEGARKNSGADIAAAVTGIAGPTGGTHDKPVGTVWLAVSTAKSTVSTHAFYPRGRESFKQLVSQKALDLIRLSLQNPTIQVKHLP